MQLFLEVAASFESLYRESTHSRSMKSDNFESREAVTLLLQAPLSDPTHPLRVVVHGSTRTMTN